MNTLLAMIIGIVRSIPDTAISGALEAQAAAEAAAALAVENGYSITFADGYEILSEGE